MGGALLVADQHMVYLRVQEVVVDRDYHPTWISENDLHALTFKQCQQSLRAFQKPHLLILDNV
jgi:hypothetical protein